MTIRPILAASVASVTLAACSGGLMPSQYAYLKSSPEQVEQWLSECEGNNNDSLRKARNCELANKSIDPSHKDYAFTLAAMGEAYQRQNNWQGAEDAFLDAIAAGQGGDVYANLAYVRQSLGKFDAARNDLGMAYEETGNLDYLEQIADLDYALEAAAIYDVDLTGIACRSVQSDSIVNPANEISLHIVTSDAHFGLAVEAPGRGKTFTNMKAGSAVQTQINVFDAEGLEPFSMSVMMWEIDDGGPAVDVAVFYGAALAGKGSSSTRSQYRGAPVSRPQQKSATSSNPVAAILNSAFGTANDFMGDYSFRDMVAADIIQSEARVEMGITYDFKSTHRLGGADCSAYFALRLTEMSDEEYAYLVNDILEGDF